MKRALLVIGLLVSTQPVWAAERVGEAREIPPHELLKLNKGEVYLGKKDARVDVIEYASMSCSHCADFSNTIFPEVSKEYIKTGKIRYVLRHFVLNEPAMKGAQLVECAPKGKHYKFVKVLFKLQEKWAFTMDTEKALKTIANVGGMSDADFTACMKDKALQDEILQTRLDAEKNLKIEGTPTFFMNGEKVTAVSDFAKFKAALDPILKQAEESEGAAAPAEKTSPDPKKE